MYITIISGSTGKWNSVAPTLWAHYVITDCRKAEMRTYGTEVSQAYTSTYKEQKYIKHCKIGTAWIWLTFITISHVLCV
jgi:hypothetical protein